MRRQNFNAVEVFQDKMERVGDDNVTLYLVVDCIYHQTLVRPLLATMSTSALVQHTAALFVGELRKFLEGWAELGWRGLMQFTVVMKHQYTSVLFLGGEAPRVVDVVVQSVVPVVGSGFSGWYFCSIGGRVVSCGGSSLAMMLPSMGVLYLREGGPRRPLVRAFGFLGGGSSGDCLRSVPSSAAVGSWGLGQVYSLGGDAVMAYRLFSLPTYHGKSAPARGSGSRSRDKNVRPWRVNYAHVPRGHSSHAVQTDASSEGLAMEERLTRQVFDGPRGQVTIDDLSDDVLLEIFDFDLDDKDPNEPCSIDKWHPLVHMCRWWRSVVFSSPRRLDLRLLCTGDRSVGAMLDIWPALPIAIVYDRRSGEMVLKNIIAALEHPDRVFHINIYNFHFPGTWEALTGAMQVPFPELTYLRLQSVYPYEAALPAGSAPRLQTLKLNYVPFSVVRDLLLSAGDLVDLSLCKVDLSEYASPKSIVACLSPFRRLESLHLEIAGCPNRQSLPPQARAILPVLTKFSFEGVNMYLEDFVARIDAPLLSQLNVSMKLVSHHVFDISRLRQFIGRARRLEPFRAASASDKFASLDKLSSLA
ncbi:hypothetical protein BC826DRAFT_972967 [Russula brevipes]|nr:hypothetical protein BC826DRAFT_972967 [Russula brevipes]